MPRRVVEIQRWQLVAAFAFVTAAFVAGLVIATNASNSAHATAVKARALAVQNKRTLERQNEIRAELVQKIHHQDVVNCRRTREGNHVLRDAIKRGIRQARATLRGPDAQVPAVRRLVLHQIAESKRFLVKLRRADCLSVPPLSTP